MYLRDRIIRFIFFIQIALLSSSSGNINAALSIDSSLVKYGATILQKGCDIEDLIPTPVRWGGNLGYAALPVESKFLKLGMCYPYQIIKIRFFDRMVAWNKVPLFNQTNTDSFAEKLKKSDTMFSLGEDICDKQELKSAKSLFLFTYGVMIKKKMIKAVVNKTDKNKIHAVSGWYCDAVSSTTFSLLFSAGGLVCWILLDKQIQIHASPSFKNVYNKCMFCVNVINNRVIFIPFYLYRHRVEVKKFLADIKLISSNQMV